MKLGPLLLVAMVPNASACLAFGISDLQYLYCLSNSQDEIVGSSAEIDSIKNLAIALGTEADISKGKQSYNYSYGWGPYFSYDDNQNGGQPDKNLTVNGIEFQRDRRLDKVGGMVIGVAGQIEGRYFWDKQRGVSVKGSVSLDRLVERPLKSSFEKLLICSKNWIVQNLYFDYCDGKTDDDKQLSSISSRSKIHTLSHFQSIKNFGVAGFELGKTTEIKRENKYRASFAKSYFSSSNGHNFSIGYTDWKQYRHRNTLRPVKTLDLGFYTAGKSNAYSFKVKEEQKAGLRFFGLDIKQRQLTTSFGIAFSKGFSTEISYSKISSNLGYYSDDVVSLTLNF